MNLHYFDFLLFNPKLVLFNRFSILIPKFSIYISWLYQQYQFEKSFKLNCNDPSDHEYIQSKYTESPIGSKILYLHSDVLRT